ncbi:MAG: helicase-exonuclease AddAB subunit AddA [Sarcina sp.]
MGTKWTNEQLAAIKTRGCNLLVAAAAGSGKTAVLVERIIRMITDKENPTDIDKLLVVTFTNAAASEMRERIGDAISKELEKNPNSSILQRQLALLNRASITTMHSFCLEIIKNNFHLIDLDPSFRIGDDTECTLIKQELLIDLFEEKYYEGDKNFLALVEAYGGSKSDDKLHDIVLKLYHFSMSGPWPEEWLIEKAEDFNISSVEELDNKVWANVIKQSMNIEVDTLLSMLNQAGNICENTSGLDPYLDNINEDIIQIEDIKDCLDRSLNEIQRVLKYIKFSTLKRVKKSDVEDESAQEKVKELRDTVKKSIKELAEKVFAVSLDESVIGINKMYPLIKCLTNLVIEFSNKYNEKKREKGILDFNDLEHLCLKILVNRDEEKNVFPSNVALELREKFEEVLVDEYQDSNNVQETIINMVSRKTTDEPNVFMVGDVKQSIYRFRQAKPELFLEKYNTYEESSNEYSRKIMLYKNFRSRKEIIEGANYIFKVLMSEIVGELKYDEKEALNLGADYKKIEENTVLLENQFLDDIKIAGDIELHILDKSAKNNEFLKENNNIYEEDETTLKDEEDLDGIQLEARIVANRIKDLMNSFDGNTYMVWDKQINRYRKLRFKDIVILLRATKNWAETFVEELGMEGIPVYADTGTGYFESIEIRNMMALLHIIDNPLQDIYMIASLRSPIFGFNAEELADIRLLNKKKYFYENIKEICHGDFNEEISLELKNKCLYFNECLIRWREKAAYTPIDEFIWYLYTDTSYYGYVGAMPNGVQRQANLRILFQRAKQYEQTSFKGLFNFINFINKLKKSSGDLGSAKILGENEDVVRIMSIHKSKGLEFPVVFLSGAGKQFNLMDLRSNLLFHEELGIGADCVDVEKRISYPTLQKYAIKKKFELETLSEEMRILYVAFTRAKEKLIITGATTDIIKSCENWNKAAMINDEFEISPSKVMKGKSYLDWIGMAMSKHPHGNLIREIGNGDVKINSQELSTWNIKVWNKSDIFVDETDKVVDNFNEKKLFIDDKDRNNIEEIEKRLNFKYKYYESCNMPSNISVSDIKKAEYEDVEEVYSMYKNSIKKKPKFIQEDKGLSSAEKGTIIHFVMQNLDLNRVDKLSDIKIQINKMKSYDLLTEEQFNIINPYKIKAFFKDELGKRLMKAFKEGNNIYRELPFLTEIPSTRINKDLDEKIYGKEKLRLQGIIDCFFEEDDGIVLLDYKTDYVEEGNENEMLEKYKVQIDLYSNTIEKITGKKVKEKFLYLFYLEKSIKY